MSKHSAFRRKKKNQNSNVQTIFLPEVLVFHMQGVSFKKKKKQRWGTF